MEIILFIFLITLFVFNYYFSQKDILSPQVFQLIPWIISIGIFILFKSEFNETSNYTFILFIIGTIFFQFGCFVGNFKKRTKKLLDKNYNVERLIVNKNFIMLLLLIITIGTLLMIIKSIKIASMVNIDNFYTSLRIGLGQLSNKTGGYGILGYLVPLSYSTTTFIFIVYLQQILYNKVNKSSQVCIPKQFVYITIIDSLIVAILSTGRGFILQLLLILVSCMYIYYPDKKKANKFMIIFGMIFIIIFIIYTLILRSNNLMNLNLKDTINYILKDIIVYTSGSIAAFDYFLNNNYGFDYGLNVFRTFFAILKQFGYDVNVVSLVQEFIPGKSGTNIYTLYHQYVKDFGIMIIPIVQFLLGILHSYIYINIKNNSKNKYIYIYFYSILLFALTMQPLLDQYLSLTSTWIQYSIYGLILFCIGLVKNKSYKNRI